MRQWLAVWMAQYVVIIGLSVRAIAQVIPDNTTPTSTEPCGAVCTINGGTRNSANLFHSFQDFNVGVGQQVRFANPAGVANILSRVTGTNPSNILGTLGVNGNANLFLLNPNGIVFGPNARLDVRGAFLATTADSFVFENGETFSVTNSAVPLLTVNVPVGLQFGTRPPGPIVNQGSLVVDSGQSLVLLGGELTFDGGGLFVEYPEGGRIDLGAVAGAGTVGLQTNGSIWSLNFSDPISHADVRFTNRAVVRAVANNSGSIALHARNLDILGSSLIQAGIGENQGTANSQAGDITINATGAIQMGQASQVVNQISSNATGNGGAIRIAADSLFLTDGAQLNANTFGQGNAGNIVVDVRDRISFDGTTADGTQSSGISSRVGATGVGSGGSIDVNAGSLSLTNGGKLSGSTFGQGNAGNVRVTVRDTIAVDGVSRTGEVVSGISSSVEAGGAGAGGNIHIDTGSLFLTNGAALITSTRNQGNAGNIFIDARDRVALDGTSPNGRFASAAFSTVEATGVGVGGNIRINTGLLSLTNGANLTVDTRGQGNAGNVLINARDRVSLDGVSRNGRIPSAASSRVATTGNGTGGNIRINTGSLFLSGGAQLEADTSGQGDAGNIFVDARNRISVNGQGSNRNVLSGAFSRVEATGIGEGGNIVLDTGLLSLTNGAQLSTVTGGRGDAGNIFINARDRISLDRTNSLRSLPNGIFSSVGRFGIGTGGDIHIRANSLSVARGSALVAGTFGQGNAGNIVVNVRERIWFDGSRDNSRFATGASSRVERTGIGAGGTIVFNTSSLALNAGAVLVANTLGQGDAGNIVVNAGDRISLDGTDGIRRNGRFPTGVASSVARTGVGAGGTIRFNTRSFSAVNGAVLSASTFGRGNSGDIIINARDVVNFDGVSRNGRAISSALSRVGPSGRGQGGDIRITTGLLSIANRAGLVSNSNGQGDAGNIRINARITRLDRGTIDATNASRNGGNIVLRDLDLLLLRRNSRIATEAGTANRRGGGNGGNIAIASDLIFAIPNENSDINANAFDGRGGNIHITTQGFFGIEPRLVASPLTSDITASSTLGVNGVIDITTPDIDPRRGLTQLPTVVVDAANQLTQTCPSGQNTTQHMSEFVVTGRGGIPPNPADILNGTATISHLSSLEDEPTQASEEVSMSSATSVDSVPESITPANAPDSIQEAQGWVIDPEGQVSLVTTSSAIAPHSSAFANGHCSGSHS